MEIPFAYIRDMIACLCEHMTYCSLVGSSLISVTTFPVQLTYLAIISEDRLAALTGLTDTALLRLMLFFQMVAGLSLVL